MRNTKVLIISSAEEGITEFHQSIEQILEKLDVQFSTINYQAAPEHDLTNVDGIIITGSPQGDDIVENHQKYFQWIKTFDKPLIGICAGHHIMAYMHHAKYFYSKEPESGECEVECIKDDPIFEGMPTKFKAFQMHNDSVSIPDGFIHLAKSEVCFNQAMKHPTKPHYTFQFHPEYLNHKIFRNFITLITTHKP